MVCEQPIDPEQGAPVSCDHRTASTGLKRPSTTTACTPTRGCCCRPRSPSISVAAARRRPPRPRGCPGSGERRGQAGALIASALAGTASNADALRAGWTASVLGFAVKAPSTLGTFLRSFRWGHPPARPRDRRVARPGPGRSGAGPGATPFTIDLDSTICETYGWRSEGCEAPRIHRRCAATTRCSRLRSGAVTGSWHRLRESAVPTPPSGAAHFLRETIGRVRAAGASGQLTMRADSGCSRGRRGLPGWASASRSRSAAPCMRL